MKKEVGKHVGFRRLNSVIDNENGDINSYHLKTLSLEHFYSIQKNNPSVIVEWFITLVNSLREWFYKLILWKEKYNGITEEEKSQF